MIIDEYTFYIDGDGTTFYYKNKKLHREEGPAFISKSNKSEFLNLKDQYSYKEVFEPYKKEIAENIKAIYSVHNTNSMKKISTIFPKTINAVISFEAPIEYVYVYSFAYYLEGIEYSKKEFDIIILKNKMEKELNQVGSQVKIVKV